MELDGRRLVLLKAPKMTFKTFDSSVSFQEITTHLSSSSYLGLSSPLQILAAQASSSPPVLVSRQPSAETLAEQPGEPQAKRPKLEDEDGTESAPHQVTPAQQPVIVAMTSQTHDPRK